METALKLELLQAWGVLSPGTVGGGHEIGPCNIYSRILLLVAGNANARAFVTK